MALGKASASFAGVSGACGLVALCSTDAAKLAAHALGSSVRCEAPLTFGCEHRDGEGMSVHDDSIKD